MLRDKYHVSTAINLGLGRDLLNEVATDFQARGNPDPKLAAAAWMAAYLRWEVREGVGEVIKLDTLKLLADWSSKRGEQILSASVDLWRKCLGY